MSDQTPQCLYCQIEETVAPLISVRYRQSEYWICPQHLPLLIHQPAKLAGILPGIEQIQGRGEHHPE
jgi:hypothetical protein